MSSQHTPGLLRLPTELRLEIYKHVWTIPHKKKHMVHPGYDSFLKAKYVKDQLSAISTLGAICRTIRDEAYREYFHTTQIYLGWGTHAEYLKGHDRKALKMIESSYLLMTQARHICVLWVNVPNPTQLSDWRWEDMKHLNGSFGIALKCLANRFQNALTLEIILEDDFHFGNRVWHAWRNPKADDHWANYPGTDLPLNEGYTEFKGIPTSYYDDYHSKRISDLRFNNLEKAVVRTREVLTHPDAVNWFNKDCLKWFQRFEKDVATLVTAAPQKEGKEPRPYNIKNHIGYLSLHWPRSDKV